jgi:hypothetical protein
MSKLALTLAALVVVAGCAPGEDPVESRDFAGTGGSATGGGTSNEGGQGGAGGLGSGGLGGGLTTEPGTGGGIFAGCAEAEEQAQLLPLDLYVMLDQSGSMLGPKWTAVTQALDTFVQDNTASDLGLGLQYFPLPGADVCDFAAYGVPAVPIASVLTNAESVSESLAAHEPGGETPTLPALQGALSHARSWVKANPTHTVAVVLATDGEPNVCGSTIDKVALAAQLDATKAPPIRTFVIGVGEELTSLDAVALAGGTGSAILVDDSSQATAGQFLAALNTIRSSALPCEYAIPAPSKGGAIDYGKVNVVLTPSGGTASVIPQVPNADACDTSPQSWHYDKATFPTKVVFCAGLCAEVKSGGGAGVRVVFGCETQIK